VVHAVLFYSPSCPHCHQVINEDLPPLFEKFGAQLNIVGVDISQPAGQALYQAAIERFSIPENRLGVPTLIIDDIVMVGSLEIPEQFPGLVEQYLALGGVDWPDIPGLYEAMNPSTTADELTATSTPEFTVNPPTVTSPTQTTALQATPVPATASPSITSPTATPGLILTDSQNSGWRDKLARDPAGNTLAIFVLIGMLAAVLWVAIMLFRTRTASTHKHNWSWLIPVLSIIGFCVAGYLAYVETAQVTAVCGPVGDCNTVQQSEYARLFGILPIGVLGLAGYTVIVVTWVFARFSNNWLADLASIFLFILTASGTLFSIYLTFLEPFVIGATCAWCLTSAVLMTALMLLSVGPAKRAFLKNTQRGLLRREYS
jgi:uncharacterized membrane protein/thiol-disulfide isomerase/thioredoxin